MQSLHMYRNPIVSRRLAARVRSRVVFQIRIKTFGHRITKCDCCGGNFELDPGPVLFDRFWKRISDFDEQRLCHQCVVKRLGIVHMWYHIVNCPWNTAFMDPRGMVWFGPPGRCWWRGPSAFRVRNYGSYVYDESAVARFAHRREAAMVARDELLEEAAEHGPPCDG